MKIAILGYGHFAGVVTVCLASRGFPVRQFDIEPHLIREDQKKASDEPGYVEMADAHPQRDFAISEADLIWACYDAPLMVDGRSNDTAVFDRIRAMLNRSAIGSGTPIVISTQWTVGMTRKLAALFSRLSFAYIVENVRAGRAIDDFIRRRFIVGTVGDIESAPSHLIEMVTALSPIFATMNCESAEMTKHALNTWLALQIAFINEVAQVCSGVGADASEVSLGMSTDPRICELAPLKPGPAFGGGSLKRDVLTLMALSKSAHANTPILHAILPSNEHQTEWATLQQLGAKALHTWAGIKPKDGHTDPFETCADADCQRVQGLAR